MENAALLSNPSGAAVAWIIGGVLVGGGLLYLVLKPKTPAASSSTTSPTPLTISPTPITPAPTPLTISPTPVTPAPPAVNLCQPVSKVNAFAASIGKSAFWDQSKITAEPGHAGQLPYVADTCSFYVWSGTGANAHWAKDDATNALFADWLTKLQGLQGIPRSGVVWVP